VVSFREASCSLLTAILPLLKRFYFGIVQLHLEVSKGLVKTSTDWTASIGRLITDLRRFRRESQLLAHWCGRFLTETALCEVCAFNGHADAAHRTAI
jgi:hypothetical protein